MGFFQKAAGILGINARNRLFISKYNSYESKKFADDKLYTKNFLQSRNIGIAKLFRVIENHQDLNHLTPDDLPDSFVIKPNHGYGGEGIIVIQKRRKDYFVSVSGRLVSFEEIFLHCTAILDGRFSISGLHDKVLIEERLIPHDDFQDVTSIGLPDIRIIVFNLVPVIAMLRAPTLESEGKANVHLGAIGAGIDMGTGKTTRGVQYNNPARKFPNGNKIRDFTIPRWEELLLSAAKIQAATKIGFLAIDFVITNEEVKVLEVNARAGLMIQIANRVMLRNRLQKIQDLKVPTPEKGVKICKTLFSQTVVLREEKSITKPVIGLFETVTFLGDANKQVLAKIDPHAEQNLVDNHLFDEDDLTADILLGEKRLRLPFSSTDFSKEEHKISLAGKYLGDFLIDAARTQPKHKKDSIRQSEEKILKNIDRKLCQIDAQIKLLSYFKPQNLEEQKKVFLQNPKKSPHFYYKVPIVDFEEMRKNLAKLPRQCDHPLMPLFLKKIEEVEQKIDLIEAINTPDLQRISENLWGSVYEPLYRRAVQFIKKTPYEEDDSAFLSFPQVLEQIEQFLQDKKLKHWKVKIMDTTVAEFQITKQNVFLVKKDAQITANRLKSLLAHEIETHVYRLENGRRAPFEIFQRGTAGYLRTEEGLASYNQVRVGVPLGEKVFWAAHRAIAAFLGKKMSFVDLFHYMKNTFDLSDDSAWRNCLKVKRGLEDTSKRITFVKDAIYFRGREEVEKFLKKKPEAMKQLYMGKIALDDLSILEEWGKKWEAKFLPSITEK